MIITVASGKGGTGKTTLSTNLAASVEGRVQLLDCDVEEPNVHIFMKPVGVTSEKVTTMVPAVDNTLCTKCGECENICSFSAIAVLGDGVMTFPEMCHSCYGCTMVCPSGALSESSRELGVVERGSSGDVALVWGRLRVGEAMSPPLIEKVKESIDSEGLTIIDAPPGTSCPVIASMKHTDFVVLITEPTPFGFNDLVLAVEAVRLMKIPFGIVVNRCDAGDNIILKYARKEGIPVLMEIPNRREIAEAYSRGIMITEIMPEMKQAFRELQDKIGRLVSPKG